MSNTTQPKALYLLNFVSMWECFSYYGMRVLLVLFMIHQLNYSDSHAFALYALYTTLVEFGGVIGGVIADRFLGLRRSIAIGGWTIALGHIALAVDGSSELFMLGLGLIIAGTNLFRSNVPALLGKFYDQDDPRRVAGFTLFYTGINIGAFLASVLCGIVGEVFGWHAGFGLAALGMLSGNVALFFGYNMLNAHERPKMRGRKANVLAALGITAAAPIFAVALYHVEAVLPWFPLMAGTCVFYALSKTKQCSPSEKNGLKRLGVCILYLILFYACEEQMGSTLMLFAERHLDRETWLGFFPAASLVMFNPLTILAAGPLLSKGLSRLPLQEATKFAASFALLGLSFCTLYAGCLFSSDGEVVPLAYAIISVVLMALGEILIGPTVFSAASELAPPPIQGLTMGMVTLGFSLASLLSGYLSQMMVVTEESASLSVYAEGFSLIGSICIAIGVIILITKKRQAVLQYDIYKI